MGLRDLDDRLVPRAAVWLRSTLDDAADRRGRVRALLLQRWQALLDPSRPGVLRRLDDRYASRGPLHLLRDVPQLGVLVVAAVFLAGAGIALARQAPESVRERQLVEQEEALPLTLGVQPGQDVDTHLGQARERAVELAREAPTAQHLALLSVRDELTAEQAGSLTTESELGVRKVYVRAPVAGDAELLEVDPGDDVVATLTDLFAQTARRKGEEQREFLTLARSITSVSEEDKQFKASYEAAARTAGLEAAAFRTGCACVLAVVVEGPAAQLAELGSLPLLRGVEVAPRGAELTSLEITPLAPETTGTVPEPVVGGG